MNIEQAKAKGCPTDLLKLIKQAKVSQIGFGVDEDRETEVNWAVVRSDIKVILEEAKNLTRRPK